MTARVLHENAHYQACKLHDGSLVVCHKRKSGGKRLVAGRQAELWADYLAAPDDNAEFNALCRAFLE